MAAGHFRETSFGVTAAGIQICAPDSSAGKAKPRGITPMTVVGVSSIRTVWPTILASA